MYLVNRRKRASDVQVRAWHQTPPPSAQSCGGGLYFRARGGGVSQWVFRYTLNGRARWLALGRYPERTLAEARQAARRAKADVVDGKDVAVEKRRERQVALDAATIGGLANDWYQHQVVSRINHPKVVRRRLDNHIIPVIGGVYLDEVRAADIDRLLRKVRVKYPATASNCLRDLKKMFKFACKREWMENNPAANFELSDAGGRSQPRTRYLKSPELAELFRVVQAEPRFGRINVIALQLLLALCVRKMELLAARWDEFDLGQGVWAMPANESVRGSSMKKRAIDIPLAPAVILWLQELKVFSAGSEHLFPARRVSKRRRFPHISPDTLNAALKNSIDIDLGHFTVHDLRRTARTHLSELGVTPDIAELALNHKIRGVRGVYDQHDYFSERSDALSKWAARLVELGAV
ncbi:MAG: tyrosine-type recombinase/integrase [Oceanococcus sp.]